MTTDHHNPRLCVCTGCEDARLHALAIRHLIEKRDVLNEDLAVLDRYPASPLKGTAWESDRRRELAWVEQDLTRLIASR